MRHSPLDVGRDTGFLDADRCDQRWPDFSLVEKKGCEHLKIPAADALHPNSNLASLKA